MTVYSHKTKLPFNEVLVKLIQNLEQWGSEVVSYTDLKSLFAKTLQIQFRNCVLIQTLSPQLIYQAISLESHAGVMLPCNILIQEHENGEVEVSAINPSEGYTDIFNTMPLSNISAEVSNKLRSAIDELHHAQNMQGAPVQTDILKILRSDSDQANPDDQRKNGPA